MGRRERTEAGSPRHGRGCPEQLSGRTRPRKIQPEGDRLYARENTIGERPGKLPPPELLADLDILLSNSFLKYASDLFYGQISPTQIDLELVFGERPVDLNPLLISAVNDNRIEQTLAGLLPDYPVYGRLKTALAEYRTYEAEGDGKRYPLAAR